MSKQPWVNKQVRRKVTELAMIDTRMAPQQIRQLVKEEFKATYLHIPGDEWVRKAVSRARKLRDDENEAWSLGSFPSAIAPDALSDVLSVWQWALLVDVGLTVRQAKWVARLRFVVPRPDQDVANEPDTVALYSWATLYAARERASELLDMPLETTDLDARLRFEDGAYWALVDTGRVPIVKWKELFSSVDEIAPEWLTREIHLEEESESQAPRTENISEMSDIERAVVEGGKRFRSLEDSVTKTQYHDANAVWILWDKSLDQSKEFQAMTDERQLKIRLTLRQEVADYYRSWATAGDSEGPHFMPSQDLQRKIGFQKK